MNAPISAESLASGKGHKDENFPVASAIVAPKYRAQIMAFYRFARGADDVADNAEASPADKLARLEAMNDTIIGLSDADPASVALREVQRAHGIDRWHALDLLEAFTRDCTRNRYESWDDLIDYCRFSAMPVGRYVLDVHGESRDLWPANDALCAALQVINHLQDCAKDYRAIDRVYLPQELLRAHGGRTEDLGGDRATPGLRAAIVDAAERTEALLHRSAAFSGNIKDKRLALEVAVIHALAMNLVRRLKTRDPLSERVHHSKIEMLAIATRAAFGRLLAR
ncbi:squalene synthase HpnC [Sphingomonas vulcanisoli]|uniref:Squalene synthase HpnC n=1 Tax=Sphingomonas vulcanisoli TaxID=1658060 RepID=A0ABX0TUL1_9SPHN|nr:squalene synthase HpnC [Sphingomonas vulcanisoli]NIJ07849.1 squalene synthase HpnC [Sphingomonas vulcanisoli]